jgi:adenine-specific DNA-methyltransferase
MDPQIELFDPPAASDALGEAWCARNDAASRRSQGITLTPPWLVERMLDEISDTPYDTIVDCGAGTGRFAMAAAVRFPRARIVAIERSAELVALLRRGLRDSGLAERVEVIEGDFRDVVMTRTGRTLYLGNPPYVRHHDISTPWKDWYGDEMARFGIEASRLAGLHVHFMAHAAALMRPGDGLCFVTSAEWLDNGYGRAVRQLFAGSAGFATTALWVAEPTEPVFDDALVSSVVLRVACGGAPDDVRAGAISERALRTLRHVSPAELQSSDHWSSWCRPVLALPSQGIELGELFRVTRGQVTGLNAAWVLDPQTTELPRELTVAAVTRAKELIDGVPLLRAAVGTLKRVVDLPGDLDAVPDEHRCSVDRFLVRVRAMGADQSYIARHRTPWHAVKMRAPPAAFVSYMGRRPPVFCANPWGASFINIAHGLYPRQATSASLLERVLHHLNTTTDAHSARVYGGGMSKFEPGDVARLRIPPGVLELAA